jgi:hypothetical protein
MVLISLLLTCTTQASYAQTRPAKQGSGQPRKQQDSFLDYTLKRINPSDKDYGACIDEGRRFVLSQTVENAYFWSNALTLGLLFSFFVVILFQRALLKRRALTYADALSQYQNALRRAEAHGDEATRRNHTFMEALRLATDPNARRPSRDWVATTAADQQNPIQTTTVEKARKGKDKDKDKDKDKGSQMSSVAPPAPGDPIAPTSPPSGVPSASPPGLDLIAQNNALQQQLVLTQDQVKQLRRQLNESGRLLESEKQKNRTVKGE